MRRSDIAKIVKDRLEYFPESGLVFWRPQTEKHGKYFRRFNTKCAGVKVGYTDDHGYIRIKVIDRGDKFEIRAHQVAVILMLGIFPNYVDHKDGDRSNNRWTNLRVLETNSKNIANQVRKGGGFKGITASGNKWFAQITVMYKHIYIGSYDTQEAAARAYDLMATKHFGEFARTNKMLGLLD